MTDPRPGTPGRSWLYAGLGALAFWIACLVYFAPTGGGAGGLTRAGAGSAPSADFSWRVLDLDDAPVEFSRFRGKTVFLNVWATWCPPCVQEMPSIAALAANPKLKDVAFVCVSVDDSAGVVRQFLAGKNWPMTFLRTPEALPSVFSTEGIPATFLIGPDGKVAASEVGSTNWDDPKVVALLETLSAPAAPASPAPAPAAHGGG